MRKSKLKIDQSVRIVDDGKMYTTFVEMADKMKLENYVSGWFLPSANTPPTGIVKAIEVIPDSRQVSIFLYGVYVPQWKKDIIINEHGITPISLMLPDELFVL